MTEAPAWARFRARQPDGALYVFADRPAIIELPGVYAGPAGFEFGPPVPYWECAGEEQALSQPDVPGWRYGPPRPGELFADEWPGWRESLEELTDAS